jgi:Na+/phosphate symporter
MTYEAMVERPERRRDDLQAMGQNILNMLRLTWEGFRGQDAGPLQAAEALGRQIHQQGKRLTAWAVRQPVGQARLPVRDLEILFVLRRLKRIRAMIEVLIRAITAMVQDGIPFTERAMRELSTLYNTAIALLKCLQEGLLTKDPSLLAHILEEGRQSLERANRDVLKHEQRLIEGVCLPKASVLFVTMLDALEEIEWQIRAIAEHLSTAPAS